MIPAVRRISDSDYSLLLAAARDGDRARVTSFLVARYAYSEDEASAWWELVVGVKAWTL